MSDSAIIQRVEQSSVIVTQMFSQAEIDGWFPAINEWDTDGNYIVRPTNTQVAEGVKPHDGVPAQWWNYYIQRLTQYEARMRWYWIDTMHRLVLWNKGRVMNASDAADEQIHRMDAYTAGYFKTTLDPFETNAKNRLDASDTEYKGKYNTLKSDVTTYINDMNTSWATYKTTVTNTMKQHETDVDTAMNKVINDNKTQENTYATTLTNNCNAKKTAMTTAVSTSTANCKSTDSSNTTTDTNNYNAASKAIKDAQTSNVSTLNTRITAMKSSVTTALNKVAT